MARGVLIYQEWATLLRRLPAALRGDVISLVLDFADGGDEIYTDDPAADMLLALMYQQVAKDVEKYEGKCRKNKENIKKRWNSDNAEEYERIQPNTNVYDRIRPNTIVGNININKNKTKEKDTHTINSVRIEKESAATAVAPTRAQTRYERFLDWLKAECPYIAAHYKLPSEELFTKLLDKYGGEAIAEQCANIENRADIRKRYTNLYQTLNNWLKRETNGNNKDDNAESSREQRAAAVADLITRLRAEDARAG